MSYFKYQGQLVYYEEYGEGPLLVMLHGNTASARMFEPLIELYKGYHIVLIDFLGHGRSQRLAKFPLDFWQNQARQVLALLEQFPNEKAILLGSSGGAISAINAGFLAPEMISCIIADSFEGEEPIPALLKDFRGEREQSLRDAFSMEFYRWMQGDDYEQIVRQDTDMMLAHFEKKMPYYFRPLSDIQIPVFLIGSRQDDMIPEVEEAYKKLRAASPHYTMHLFPEGKHPAVLSNAEAFAGIVCAYLEQGKHTTKA